MSGAAAQYDIFREQVVTGESVFTFRDVGQLLVYRVDPDGDTIPFWSSRSLAGARDASLIRSALAVARRRRRRADRLAQLHRGSGAHQ